jgi:uncharacterized protein involved in outer membrane biogenesis
MIMLRRMFAAVLAVAVLFVIGVLFLPMLLPGDYARRQLAGLLEQEAGIRLEKAETVRIRLLPAPGLVLEGAVLSAATVDVAPDVTAERITAEVHPWQLLQGRLELKRLLVEKPAILFRIDTSGNRNWDFTSAAPRHPVLRLAALGDGVPLIAAAAAASPPTLRSERPHLPNATIDIRQGTLTYLDEEHGRRVDVERVDLSLQGKPAEGTATLDGSLRLLGEEVMLKAALRSQHNPSDASAPLRVEIGTRAVSALYDGLVAWKDARGLQGRLKLELTSAAALRGWIGGDGRILASLDRATLGGTLDLGEQDAVFSDGKLEAGEATGDLDLEVGFDGRARFNLHRMQLHGGSATGHIAVDARQPAAIVSGSFEMNGVDTLALLQNTSGFDWVSGRGSAKLHIAGGGESLDTVLQTLAGEGSLTVTDGAIEGLDLPKLVGKAREGEFGKWKRRPDQRTPFDSLKSAFILDKGLAKSRELLMTGPEITTTGEGESNIAAQTMDYRLKVKVKAATGEERAKAEDGEVEIPLILRGPWDKPDIYPDLDKVMRDPKAVSDTAKAIGKSVEKFTDGKVKSEDVGKALEALFGGKKKKKAE